MGRRTVTQYANQIKRVLSPSVVNDIGREVGFCFRERVITGDRKNNRPKRGGCGVGTVG